MHAHARARTRTPTPPATHTMHTFHPYHWLGLGHSVGSGTNLLEVIVSSFPPPPLACSGRTALCLPGPKHTRTRTRTHTHARAPTRPHTSTRSAIVLKSQALLGGGGRAAGTRSSTSRKDSPFTKSAPTAPATSFCRLPPPPPPPPCLHASTRKLSDSAAVQRPHLPLQPKKTSLVKRLRTRDQGVGAALGFPHPVGIATLLTFESR